MSPDQADVPFVVVRGVELPRFVGKNTLVIMVSYSGDTWETLELFDDAVKRGRTGGLGDLGRRISSPQ